LGTPREISCRRFTAKPRISPAWPHAMAQQHLSKNIEGRIARDASNFRAQYFYTTAEFRIKNLIFRQKENVHLWPLAENFKRNRSC
jgi:hypothetical protein